MRHFSLKNPVKKSLLVVTAIVSAFSSTAFALDNAFYSTNNILFYNPESNVCATTAAVTTSVGSNDAKIYNFLISNKFTSYGGKAFGPVQAAGAIGNFFQESGWNFSAVEGNGEGHGIAQWSYGRKTILFALASSMGKQWSDPEVQLQMLKNELDGSYGKSLLGAGYDKLTDPKAAALLFEQIYEGAGTPNQANRDKAAQTAYDKYSGMPVGTSLVSCSATSTSKSDGSKASFVTSDGYAVYLQTDPRWANEAYSTTTIGAAACGPTSMTMIITALTGKAMDIREVVKVAADGGMYVPGVGSSWNVGPYLASHYGLKATKIPKTVAAVNTAVRGGGYVLMSGTGAIPFTSAGHFVHVRGITADGKWQIGDSAHKSVNETPYDPSYILSIANDNLYSITK